MAPGGITISGGQLVEPPPYAEPFFFAIGMAAAQWGRLEQHLDMLLITINKEHHSLGAFRETPNTSFDMKIELFRKWFYQDDRTTKYHERARRLSISLRKAAKDRTLLFHSNIQKFEEGPPAKMHIVNIHLRQGNVHHNHAEWTVTQILKAANGFRLLNEGLRAISREVLRPDFLRLLGSTPGPTLGGR
jgi:hypothetical protein